MVVDGIAYTFGIFLTQFVDYFGEGKGKVAWVGSLLSGVYLSAGMLNIKKKKIIFVTLFDGILFIFVFNSFLGPIVSALANKYGCRAVCIAGSVIACCAFVLSTFSTSVTMLMITYGAMGGKKNIRDIDSIYRLCRNSENQESG